MKKRISNNKQNTLGHPVHSLNFLKKNQFGQIRQTETPPHPYYFL